MGLQPDRRDGIAFEPVMKLAIEWFENANADVRDSAVKLVGACYALVGPDRVEPHLAKLRDVKRQVFEAEFERISNEGQDAASSPVGQAGGAPSAEEETDVCQFCGRQDATTAANAIDVHYWRECPMLTECELCQQVVEISTLVEHWQTECEKQEEAAERVRAVAQNQCPLCLATVNEEDEQAWLDHLIGVGCPKNPRDEFRKYCNHRRQ